MHKKIVMIVLSMALTVLLDSAFTFTEASDDYIYVGNWNPASHVSVVNIESNTIIKNIPGVPKAKQFFVSPDGVQTYVRSGYNAVVIDNVDQIVVKPRLEYMSRVQAIAISPDSSLVFAGAYNPRQAYNGGQPRYGGGLFTFDTSDFEKLRAYNFGEHGIQNISVRNDGKYIYADGHYSRDNFYIRIYDVEGNFRLRDLDVWPLMTKRVLDMAQDPDGRYLYVAGMSHGNHWEDWLNYGYIKTIDMDTNQLVHTLTVWRSRFRKIEVSPNGLYACVIDDHYKKLCIIDLRDYSYRSVYIGEDMLDYTGGYRESIIFSPDSSYVYVLKMQSNSVTAIDLNNAVEVNNIALSGKPCQMIMTPDGSYIYVTIPSLHKVSVIDVATDTIVENITGFTYPSSIVYVAIKNNPPELNMGDDLLISSQDQDSTIVQAGATDPDGDELWYRWLKDDEEVSSWNLVGVDGEAYLDLGTVPYLSVGEYLLTLEVDDGQIVVSDSITLTIGNSKPVASPAGAGTYQINTPVALNGQVSDFDGDLLYYEWLDGEDLLFFGEIQTEIEGIPISLPEYATSGLNLGIHEISLKVSDGTNEPVISNVSVEVIDSIAPTLAPVTGTQILWPPNHSMVDIVVEANAQDNGGGLVTLSATIFSSEEENGLGDGDTAPDWTEPQIDQLNGIITFQLRAERMGSGSSREYTVIIGAADDSGNQSEASIKFIVPHDKRGKK